MKILKYETKLKIDYACQLIKDNHLYVSGWGFQKMIKEEKRHHCISSIYVAWIRGSPVGVSILGNIWSYNIGVYVKPKHRKKSIGTKLIKKALEGKKLSEFKYDATYSRFWDSIENVSTSNSK